MIERDCPLCEGTENREYCVDHEGYRIRECTACGFLFQSPVKEPDAMIGDFYGEIYNREGSYEIRTLDDYLAHPLFLRSRENLARKFAMVEAHVKPGRLLDVGCGLGVILYYAQTRGWEPWGTEIVAEDCEALAKATGFHVACADLLTYEPDVRFDLVNFHHVVEHLPDPRGTLVKARELLAPSGLLLVEVPSVGSISCRLKTMLSRMGLARKPFKNFDAYHHINYFTPRTIGALVENCGFEVLRCQVPTKGKGGLHGLFQRSVLGPLGCGWGVEILARPRSSGGEARHAG